MIENLELKTKEHFIESSVVNRVLEELSKILEIRVTLENINDYVQDLRHAFFRISSGKVKRYIALALVIASTYKVDAQEQLVDSPPSFPVTTTVGVNNLRLRLRPGLDAEILDYLQLGDQVRVLGLDQTSAWAMVSTDLDNNPEGFVYSNYLNDFEDLIPTINNSISITANVCATFIRSDGRSQSVDSGGGVCALESGTTAIIYAHNYTEWGRLFLNLYDSQPGTLISNITINGVNQGTYKVVRSYTASGIETQNLLSPEAKNSFNNDYITIVTTDPVMESVDPAARRITLVRRVVVVQ